MVMVVALSATITIVVTGCSGQTSATAPPPVSTTASVATTPPPLPTSTLAPLPTSTSAPRPSPTSPPSPSPTPTQFDRAVPERRSTPVRIQIPAIRVDSSLMALGLGADGSMEVPPGGFPAGWYTGGPTPGELGPAVIAGHIDLNGPGVFYRLGTMKPGDRVTVTRADGSKPVFRVTRVAQFQKDQFPTRQVYGNLNHAGLRLITCGGTFNTRTGHYEDNLVVFADLVAPPR